jgi:hypothetical protein
VFSISCYSCPLDEELIIAYLGNEAYYGTGNKFNTVGSLDSRSLELENSYFITKYRRNKVFFMSKKTHFMVKRL